MLQNTEGIVIRTQDYRETHKLVTIFTKEFGKVTAISRGANKPHSRLAAVSQLFIEANFLLYLTKGLATLQQGEVRSTYRQIRSDLWRTAYASYMIEMTDRLLEEKEPHPYVYRELKDSLDWLDREEEFIIPVMMYEMKLFELGGFAPVIDRCVACQRRDGLFAFSVKEGGVLCRSCLPLDKHAKALPQALFRILMIFSQLPLHRVGRIRVKEENIQILRSLFDQYYDRYGGYQLKSKKFLQSISKLDMES